MSKVPDFEFSITFSIRSHLGFIQPMKRTARNQRLPIFWGGPKWAAIFLGIYFQYLYVYISVCVGGGGKWSSFSRGPTRRKTTSPRLRLWKGAICLDGKSRYWNKVSLGYWLQIFHQIFGRAVIWTLKFKFYLWKSKFVLVEESNESNW